MRTILFTGSHSLHSKSFLLLDITPFCGSHFVKWKPFLVAEVLPFIGIYFFKWKPFLMLKPVRFKGWYTYDIHFGGRGAWLRQKWDVSEHLDVKFVLFLLKKIGFAPWTDIMLRQTLTRNHPFYSDVIQRSHSLIILLHCIALFLI